MTNQEQISQNKERLRTAKELVTDLGGISLSKLYKLSEAGLIPHYRVGRGIRFLQSEVLAALHRPIARGASDKG